MRLDQTDVATRVVQRASSGRASTILQVPDGYLNAQGHNVECSHIELATTFVSVADDILANIFVRSVGTLGEFVVSSSGCVQGAPSVPVVSIANVDNVNENCQRKTGETIKFTDCWQFVWILLEKKRCDSFKANKILAICFGYRSIQHWRWNRIDLSSIF